MPCQKTGLVGLGILSVRSYYLSPSGEGDKNKCSFNALLCVLAMFQVLAELKEYATEVDVDFVRKAVRAIGRCAIKVEVRPQSYRPNRV